MPGRAVGLAATFSCEPAAKWLKAWLRQFGTEVDVRLAPYNALLAELTSPSAFREAHACVGLLNLSDWQRPPNISEAAPAAAASTAPQFDAARFESDLQLLVDCLHAALGSSGAISRLLLIICPSRAAASARSFAAAADRLKALTLTLPRLAVLTPSELAAWYPVAEPHDLIADAIGHLPYTESLFCSLGAAAARWLLPALAPASGALLKCVAVDADYTLWHGAVGELGPAGVSVEPRHAQLQARLIDLRERGVLIALCSRNEEADVWAVFERASGMMLSREHAHMWGRIGRA